MPRRPPGSLTDCPKDEIQAPVPVQLQPDGSVHDVVLICASCLSFVKDLMTMTSRPLMDADDPGRPVGDESTGRVGWVHSRETASAVDGPGFRYVVWLAGCQLRCLYCHNPDTWAVARGQRMTDDAVLADVASFRAFLSATGGGFTISGGEPLVQHAFAMQLIRRARRELTLHTALDTNGYLGERLSDDDLANIDLVLLDLKAYHNALHQRVTGVDNTPILRFAQRLDTLRRPTWVRFVLVPGLTDDADDIAALASFVAPLRSVERVEILPFHQMGRPKWHQLNKPYTLQETPTPHAEQVEAARSIFQSAGCIV